MRQMKAAGVSVILVALAVARLAAVQGPNLASAESFGVLAGVSVTNTGTTTVAGDVGVGPGGSISGDPITLTGGGAAREGDAVTVQARLDAASVYDDLAATTCDTDLTGQNLGGQSLGPGVYCFDADAELTGSDLTLAGTGRWIFVVSGALTTEADVVVDDGATTCRGSSVFWVVAEDATIGTGTSLVGTVLARQGVTLEDGAEVDGRAVALDDTSIVSLDGNTVTACSFGKPLPAHAPLKVTGGGQIGVPDSDSAGFASYGFNARPDGDGNVSGRLTYRNHFTGLQLNGAVTDLDVLTVDADGAPEMVRLSGTCSSVPAKKGARARDDSCTFSVTVEDGGEPSADDRFGIVVVGSPADESTSHRAIENGNIQVHQLSTARLNKPSFRPGEVLSLSLSMAPAAAAINVDAYLVLRLPGGQLISWTPSGLVAGIVPFARNVAPGILSSVEAQLQVPAGAPAGTYTWLSAHTAAGSATLVSEIVERSFTITP